MLRSGSIAQLALVLVDPAHPSSTVIRYALNAFAVRCAIESGATAMLLDCGLRITPGHRVMAMNVGYRPRRLRLVGSR